MKNYKNISNKQELVKLYIENKIPVSKLAIRFGVCHKTMSKVMSYHGIDIKGRISANKLLRDKEWLRKQYIDEKLSIKLIAEKCDSTRGNVHSALRFANIPIRSVKEGIQLTDRLGSNASNWKGGRRTAGTNGRYIQVLSHGHPNVDYASYVMEHRLVMEEKIGRYLTKDEIIHHKDGDGHNNNIDNLQLTTRKKHFNDHFDAVKEVNRLKKLLEDNSIAY